MKPKLIALLIPLFATVGLLVTGCGGGKSRLDTAEFDRAFATADPSLKGPADEASKALKEGKFFEGTTALANLAKSSEKLSEPQKNAMINLAGNIEKIMAGDGDKADIKVFQAVNDMMAALEGRESAKAGVNPDTGPAPKPPGE